MFIHPSSIISFTQYRLIEYLVSASTMLGIENILGVKADWVLPSELTLVGGEGKQALLIWGSWGMDVFPHILSFCHFHF